MGNRINARVTRATGSAVGVSLAYPYRYAVFFLNAGARGEDEERGIGCSRLSSKLWSRFPSIREQEIQCFVAFKLF